ncbi:hypothetical protein MBAV_003014 [Candidatus Magnetobacterium bavaricum]|uniref:Uncharacterized protein n=1 Tax=Candidatus Magnetobacterium bavaricum TaxID=29290 RepID=A0A0F3GSA8_9BACT|nr:hypothetical protein MBAV_003014 [Candidatus Magnetobacterium bavaricum]
MGSAGSKPKCANQFDVLCGQPAARCQVVTDQEAVGPGHEYKRVALPQCLHPPSAYADFPGGEHKSVEAYDLQCLDRVKCGTVAHCGALYGRQEVDRHRVCLNGVNHPGHVDPVLPRLTQSKYPPRAQRKSSLLDGPDGPELVLKGVGGAYPSKERLRRLDVVVVPVQTRLFEHCEGVRVKKPQRGTGQDPHVVDPPDHLRDVNEVVIRNRPASGNQAESFGPAVLSGLCSHEHLLLVSQGISLYVGVTVDGLGTKGAVLRAASRYDPLY